MGYGYMLLNDNREYLLLAKKGSEWSNDLWKIWEFINSSDDLRIIRNDNPRYDEIINNKDCHEFDEDDYDIDDMYIALHQLISGIGNLSRKIEAKINLEETNKRKLIESEGKGSE